MKKSKKEDEDLYYVENVQAKKEDIEDIIARKKKREREKRVRENNNRIMKEEALDPEMETVINMTNKNRIKHEEENRKKINRITQKRQKRNKKIKFFLRIFIFAGLIIGGTIFSLTSPIFNITNIEVLNNTNVSSETVISLSGLTVGNNIFKYYTPSIVKKIKENAYVENVEIHRKLPGTVQIDIKERIPKYSIDYMGQFACINTQGYILEIAEESKGLPVIQGICTNEEDVAVGERLNQEDLIKMQDVIKIMDSAQDNGIDNLISNIDISEKNEYTMYLNEEKKRIHLGDSTNLSNKMLYIVSILEQEKGKEGDIFVNGDLNSNKFRAFFREKV